MKNELEAARQDLNKYFEDEYHILKDSTIDLFAKLLKQEKEREIQLTEPLTIDELKEMGGKPYWHKSFDGKFKTKTQEWRLLPDHIALNPHDYRYGENWLAYRQEPAV